MAVLIFLSVITFISAYPANENTDVEYSQIRHYTIYPFNKYMLDKNGELKETKDILNLEYKYPNFVMSWESTTGKHQYTFSFVPVYKSNNLETTFNNLMLADSRFKVNSTINDLSDGKEFYYSMQNIPTEVGYFKMIIEPKAASMNERFLLPDKIYVEYSDLSNQGYNLQTEKDGSILLYPKSGDWLPMESFDPYFKVSSMNFDASVTYNEATGGYIMANTTTTNTIGSGLSLSGVSTYGRHGQDFSITAIPHNCYILNVSEVIYYDFLTTNANDKRDQRLYFNFMPVNASNGTKEARWNLWGLTNQLMLNADWTKSNSSIANVYYFNRSANNYLNTFLHSTFSSKNNLFSISLHTSEDGDPDGIEHTISTLNSSESTTPPYLNISCVIQDVI